MTLDSQKLNVVENIYSFFNCTHAIPAILKVCPLVIVWLYDLISHLNASLSIKTVGVIVMNANVQMFSALQLKVLESLIALTVAPDLSDLRTTEHQST